MMKRAHLQQLLAWMITRLAASTDDYVEVPRDSYMDLIDVVNAAIHANLQIKTSRDE